MLVVSSGLDLCPGPIGVLPRLGLEVHDDTSDQCHRPDHEQSDRRRLERTTGADRQAQLDHGRRSGHTTCACGDAH